MLKKFLGTVVLGIILNCGTGMAGTEAEEMAAAMAQAQTMFANEPPLTQADIDAFATMAPKVSGVAADPNAIFQLYQENNISPQRFAIISSKISLGLSMANGMTRDQIAQSGINVDIMAPDEAELALITKNAPALTKALQGAM